MGGIMVTENGLREVGIDYRFSNHTNNNASNLDSNDDEVYTLVGALECIIKQKSEFEILSLSYTADEDEAYVKSHEVEEVK
ncbi:hypothetical protein Tco_1366539 [Tanacetum coccineum]